MRLAFIFGVLICLSGAAFAARSQEPVVITTCRSFEARCDDQSKTALAGRFRENCKTCGDCDDINKVCANKILSFGGIMQGKDGVMKLEASYPDGQSYNYYILFNAHEDDAEREVEYWASHSPDFKRGTYAIAISPEDKRGYDAIFASAEIAPSVVPAILYSLGNDMSLTDAPQLARRKSDLALLSILELMAGPVKGYTKEFVLSGEWFDISRRNLALKELRDFVLDNPCRINLNPAIDENGRDFAYYMQKFSGEYEARARAQFALESRDFDAAKTPALDAEALRKARENFRARSAHLVGSAMSNSGNAPAQKFGGLSLKKKKSRRR
ncbi:MAG: hypothetical protein IKS15_00060 [Opitutales bacterium]|nr:hypothetical protein [Opitutales bacterium]